MFGSITLGQSYTSKEYKKLEPMLHMKLFELQKKCEELKIPVLITLAGLDGTGRGEIVNSLSTWFDAKKMRTHTFWHSTEEAATRPEAWRFWINLPARHEVGIFMGGWYGEPIRLASTNEISEQALFNILSKRVEMERVLANDGYAIIKFWLHIDKKEHSKRQEKRRKEKGAYHFSKYEEKSESDYDSLVNTMAKAIPLTDREYAPWCIVDAYDKNFRNVTIARALIQSMEHAIEKKMAVKNNIENISENDISEELKLENNENYITILDRVDLTKSIEKDVYKKELEDLQNDVFKLSYKAFKLGISSTIIFEGVDAAGKGGAIRRLSSAIDARITRLIPISSPTDEELARHYLWRFWRHVPMSGYVTIYDRSWYGRVLVERVEGYAKPEEWKRAYSEINDFEEQLVDNKNILIKFWLQISSDEQLARFKDREDTPWKNYKITSDDWRNRDKSSDYNIAADEMFMRTDTLAAPWHIIPGESKLYARIEVLKIYREALRKALGKNADLIDSSDTLLSIKDKDKKDKSKKK